MIKEVINIKKKFYNVELLRFIFAVMVVVYHIKSPYGDILMQPFIAGVTHWNICVDFFFIISGFFLFYTLNTAQTTFDFARKKFFRLVPILYFLIICTVFSNLIFHTPFSYDGNILKIFLLHDLGFAPKVSLGISWFISVLFWVSLFYFYILKIIDKKYHNLLMWMITIFSLSLLLNWNDFNTGGLRKNIFYFINSGVLRGLGGMGIGYFISMLYKSGFMQDVTNILHKIIITVIEISCILFLVVYLCFTDKLPGQSAFLYSLIFSIIFYLFIINKGFVAKLLNKKFLGILGENSYAIYVMQILVLLEFNTFVIDSGNIAMIHPRLICIIIVLSCITVGVLVHYLFEIPVNKYLNRKYLKRNNLIKN